MNKISFAGRIAADCETRFTASGDAITGFRVASDVGYGDKKTTNWFSCQIWGKRGEAIAQYLTKGQQVTVWGQLTMREWTDKDGAKKLSPDVRVDEIALQGGKQKQDGYENTPAVQRQQSGQRQQHSTPEQFISEDIPFANPYRGKYCHSI